MGPHGAMAQCASGWWWRARKNDGGSRVPYAHIHPHHPPHFPTQPPCALYTQGPIWYTGAMATKSTVNKAGNYTKPEMRKRLFNEIKASATQGTKAGQWSARKAQLLAKRYKEKGGGYRD